MDYWGDSQVLREILDYHYENSDYTHQYLYEALNYLGMDHPIVANMLELIKTKDNFAWLILEYQKVRDSQYQFNLREDN